MADGSKRAAFSEKRRHVSVFGPDRVIVIFPLFSAEMSAFFSVHPSLNAGFRGIPALTQGHGRQDRDAGTDRACEQALALGGLQRFPISR